MSSGAAELRALEERLADIGFRVRVEAAGEGGEIAVVSPEDPDDWDRVFRGREPVIRECLESGFRYAALELSIVPK